MLFLSLSSYEGLNFPLLHREKVRHMFMYSLCYALKFGSRNLVFDLFVDEVMPECARKVLRTSSNSMVKIIDVHPGIQFTSETEDDGII